MHLTPENRKENEYFKTAYQRAHYYQKLPDNPPKSVVKEKVRTDVYFYDPIINEKQSTTRQSYGKKELDTKVDRYGRLNCITRKYTIKNLFKEYQYRPAKPLTYNKTSSGLQYKDPKKTPVTKLLEKFCIEILPNGINSSFNEKLCHPEYLEPYISSTHFVYRDFNDPLLKEIGNDDIITYYNNRVKNKIPPPPPKVYNVKRKVPFKVPFNGDSSIKSEDYKDPAKKSAFLSDMCLAPDLFEAMKTKVSIIPGMYFTDQKHTGSGKPVQAIV